jgi:hypothetical protein
MHREIFWDEGKMNWSKLNILNCELEGLRCKDLIKYSNGRTLNI